MAPNGVVALISKVEQSDKEEQLRAKFLQRIHNELDKELGTVDEELRCVWSPAR